MPIAGFIDATKNWSLHGWAYDSSTPDASVEVDLTLSSGWHTTVLANRFRSDLCEAGLGNGCHAFEVRLPSCLLLEGPHTITARVRGTDFVLTNSPFPVSSGFPVEVVAGDIVNNCNLRCPFCITDYELIRGLKVMTPATFIHSIKLLPLVEDGGFWLSCMHEPTLHPSFADLVELIPIELRKKVSFTTNLCKRVPDSTLQRLADSGVHSIRVSLDSLDPELFQTLRKGGRFSLFIQQLETLSNSLTKTPNAPRLDFITVVLKDNLHEVRELLGIARERFNSGRHEIRFMYYSPHLAKWGVDHIITTQEWDDLKHTIIQDHPGFPISIGDPPADVATRFELGAGLTDYEKKDTVFGGSDTISTYKKADPLISGYPVPDSDLRLRLRWDGVMMAEQIPESQLHLNVLDLADPAEYFHRLRRACLQPLPSRLGIWNRK